MLRVVFLIAFAGACLGVPNPDIVIRNVTAVNVVTGKLDRNVSVVITGNRIARVGRGIKPGKGSTLIDGTGKFVIPGLWDMHVHVFNNGFMPGTNHKDDYFPMFIANGVTGVRDMWTDPDDIKLAAEWNAEIEAGRLLAPRLMVASRIVDGAPVVHDNSLGVANANEARSAVRTLKAAGAGFIKVYDLLSRESYFAIAAEAKRLNIAFAGHVPLSVSPWEASDAGQKSIEHLTGMDVGCSTDESRYRSLKQKDWTPALRKELMDSYDDAKCRRMSAVFVKNQTWHDPTLVVLRSRFLSDLDEVRNSELLKYVHPEERKAWLAISNRMPPAMVLQRKTRFQRQITILEALHSTGVQILAGTDVGNEYIFAGFSLHDELSMLVDAGFTPLEALQAATINPAKYLGLERRYGAIEKGKSADLVLLNADPLVDIANTRKIHAVLLNGKLLPQSKLEAMLKSVENLYTNE